MTSVMTSVVQWTTAERPRWFGRTTAEPPRNDFGDDFGDDLGDDLGSSAEPPTWVGGSAVVPVRRPVRRRVRRRVRRLRVRTGLNVDHNEDV